MSHYGHVQSGYRIGPQCAIQLSSSPDFNTHIETEAIIDSGAVITCIPFPIIQKLRRAGGLVRGRSMYITGANGIQRKRECYYLNIFLPDFNVTIRQIRVVSLPEKNYVIIGRDILNEYKVALNGCQRLWSLNCTVACDKNSDIFSGL